MFTKKIEEREHYKIVENLKKSNESRLEEIEQDNFLRTKATKFEHDTEMSKLKNQQELALKQKEFELKHFKDEELKKLTKELIETKQNVAVLTKENEMLVKITDLNADVIDVKELVGSLIKKLPEVNINTISVQSHGMGNEQKK
jgi:hypothetical protein